MSDEKLSVNVRTFQPSVCISATSEQVVHVAGILRYAEVTRLVWFATSFSEMVASPFQQQAYDHLEQLGIVERVEGKKSFYQLTLLGWAVVDFIIDRGFAMYGLMQEELLQLKSSFVASAK